ncbi:hypothetical protein PT273_02025 [Orbaceae bacterium ESL0727]|nr:hypothetical protein [Orbaceae bacterium ESL0727]
MMIKKNYLLALCPLFFLVGCSTTPEQCDPSNTDIGIMDKISCNYSGNYQKRIDQKKQILLNEQRANQQFKEIYATIEKQKNDTTLSIQQKQAEQQKLQASLNSLTTEIKAKTKSRDDLQQQMNDIDAQLKKVNNGGGSIAEKQVELEELNTKLQQLQKALNL